MCLVFITVHMFIQLVNILQQNGYYNLINAYYSQCILCIPSVQQSNTVKFHYQLVA